MPYNVQCKCCANLKNHWCDLVRDDPDEDLVRDCCHYRTLTNADRIRSMTDEELAEWLDKHDAYIAGCYSGNCGGKDCTKCWLDWLRGEEK